MVARRLTLWTTAVLVCSGLPSLRSSGEAADPKSQRPVPQSKQHSRGESSATASISPERLIRIFRTDREDAKLQAVREAERFRRVLPKLADALWEVIQPAREGRRWTPALLAAVRLFAELPDDDQSERQLALLDSPDIRLALTAADPLARRQTAPALARIAALRDRPEYRARYAVRHAVATALAEYDDPAAIDWFLKTLAESDGQLKYESARHRARVTGQNFGGNAAKWQTWWDQHRAELPKQRLAAPPQEIPWDIAVPKFYSAPIYAKRVVFVVDRSLSMQSSVDGVTRLDDAQRELERTVRALPESTWFNLLAYDTLLESWRDRLVPATIDNKSASLRFIYSQMANRQTAAYEALDRALDLDPDLELIVFLSDGEPTAGRIVAGPQIVQAITAKNAGQRVSIDVLGIDAEGPAEQFLQQLSQSNFGTYRPIR